MFKTIHQMRDTYGAAQNGSALILALLVLLVMSIVVMGMAADTDMDLKISHNLQLKNEAFNNAETGLALATEMLRESTVVNHINENNDESINLLSIKDHKIILSRPLIDFYELDGNITISRKGTNKKIASVYTVSHDYGNGRRWFELYSIGTKESSSAKMKATISEDISFNHENFARLSPLTLFNENPSLMLKGSIFVSGKNHPVPSSFDCTGAGCSPDSPYSNGDKLPLYSYHNIEEQDIVQQGNAEIEDFVYEDMKQGDSEDESSEAISDEKWNKIVNSLVGMSSTHYLHDDNMPDSLGTRDTPGITVIEGEHNLNALNGAGILILKDGARITGNFHFEGLVISIIDSEEDGQLLSGGNNTIYGSMLVLGGEADIEIEGEDDSVDYAGTPGVLHSEEGLNSAFAAHAKEASLHRLSWSSL